VNQEYATSAAPEIKRVRDAVQLHIVSVVPEMSVRELIRTFLENSITGAPVVDSAGMVIGVVSTTDVLQLGAREAEIPAGQIEWNPVIQAEEADAEETSGVDARVPFTLPTDAAAEAAFDSYQVGDIMTPVPFTVRPMDTLGTAIRMMRQGRVHRLLVMENGFLLGIITPFDILDLVDWE
jgi:predicted transcriptional regulator